MQTGRQVFQFKHAGARLTALGFDCTGRKLVTGADDGAVRIFNYSSGELLRTYATDAEPPARAAHPGAGPAELRDEPLEQAPPPRCDEVTAVLHVDCVGREILCAAGWSRHVSLWFTAPSDAAVQRGAKSLRGHGSDILCMEYAPPCWLATGSYAGEVLMWDLNSLKAKRRLVPAHTPRPALAPPRLPLRAARASRGRGLPMLASAAGEDELRMCVAVERMVFLEPPARTGPQADGSVGSGEAVGAAADGAERAGGQDGDGARGAPLASTRAADASGTVDPQLQNARAPTPLVVTISADGFVRFWDVATSILVHEQAEACEPGEALTALAKGEESRLLVTGDSGGFVRLWDVAPMIQFASGVPRPRRGPAQIGWAQARRIGASPSMQSIASVARSALDRRARESHRLEDGQQGAAASSGVEPDGPVRLRASWRAHSRAVTAVEYLESVSRFLSAGSDCTVRMWSLAGEQVGVFGQPRPWDLAERSTWLDARPVEPGAVTELKHLPSSPPPLASTLPPPMLASLLASLKMERRRVQALQGQETAVRARAEASRSRALGAAWRQAACDAPSPPRRRAPPRPSPRRARTQADDKPPGHEDLKSMHELTKGLRPDTARARRLLDPSHFKLGKQRQPEAAGARQPAPGAGGGRGAGAFPTDALRLHTAEVLRRVLPAAQPSGSGPSGWAGLRSRSASLLLSGTPPRVEPWQRRGSLPSVPSGALERDSPSGASAAVGGSPGAKGAHASARMWAPGKSRIATTLTAGGPHGSQSRTGDRSPMPAQSLLPAL